VGYGGRDKPEVVSSPPSMLSLLAYQTRLPEKAGVRRTRHVPSGQNQQGVQLPLRALQPAKRDKYSRLCFGRRCQARF
jgi:hypothetical protein